MRRPLKLALMLSSAVVVALSGAWRPLKTGVYFVSDALMQTGNEVALQRQLQRELAAGLKSNPSLVMPAGFQGTVIYVISASTTRRHLSLYGYHRDTTPKLNRLQDSILLHQDTISPSSYATQSLPAILSVGNLGRGDSKETFRLNLFTELRRAGFKTWWLSNQNEFKIWDNPVSQIANQAEVQRFNKNSFGILSWGDFYDDQMLPDLDTALRDPASRKFILVHLHAVHSDYCNGIPPRFRDVLKAEDGLGKKFFGDAPDLSANVNCYDNAVRYVDHILDQIILKAKSHITPTVMVYLSDHGENPAHGNAHHPMTPFAYHIEVPHLWYFNAYARQVLSPKIDALKANLDKPYKSSDMFHTMLDLIGADPLQYDASRSITSTKFLLRPRKTVPRNDVDYVNNRLAQNKRDYLEIARLELAHIKATRLSDYRKLWAHRVDSIGKLMEAKSLFAGVEVDIVFDRKARDFFVFHPPKESHGLSLREFLLATKERPDLWFWFDWKNANQENFDAAFLRLMALDDEFSMKRRSLIETGSDAMFSLLRKLSRSGFTHSYYVPTAEAVACARQPNKKICAELAEELTARARQIGAVAISFDGKASGFVSANISSFRGLQMASWQLDLSVSDKGFSSKIQPLDGIEALLVRFPSNFSY